MNSLNQRSYSEAKNEKTESRNLEIQYDPEPEKEFIVFKIEGIIRIHKFQSSVSFQ